METGEVLQESEAGDACGQRVDMVLQDGRAPIDVEERQRLDWHEFESAGLGRDRVLVCHGMGFLSVRVGRASGAAGDAQGGRWVGDGQGRAREASQKP